MAGERALPAFIKIGAIDKLSKTLDKVQAKFPALSRVVSRTDTMFSLLQNSTEKFRKTMDKVGEGISSFGVKASIGITAPVVAAAGLSIKKFSEIEDALIEVKGSTNLSNAELKTFGERISKISTILPVSQEELLKLAQASGEAGVRGVDNLEKFSTTLAKLGKTANVNAAEIADPIAKVLNLSGEGVGKIENFASAVTGLADKYGVSAKRVLESTLGISRQISEFGVSSSNIAALATAIEPLGFEAKQAETAIGESFRGINQAIVEGGIKMKGLEIITGMTGEEIKKRFKEDPTAVFQSFIGGLDKIKAKGGDSAKALQFFGVSGDKTGIILSGLAKNNEKLNETLKSSGELYAENKALTEEYGETTGTFSAKMKLLHNNVDVLAVKLGAQLVPAVSFFADLVTRFIQFLDAHPALATFIAYVAGAAAVIGPAALALGNLIKIFSALTTIINGAIAVWTALAAVEWIALAPLLLIIAKFILIGALVAGLIYVIYRFRDAIWNGLVNSLTFVWDLLKKIHPGFMLLNAVIEKFSGGKTVNLNQTSEVATTPQGEPLVPAGPGLGAREGQQKLNPEFSSQTNNARVDINVRAPQSTQIKSESEGGFLNINRGLAGVF